MRVQSNFIWDESGAISTDWVVMTGALAGLGIATAVMVSAGLEDLTATTSSALSNMALGFTDAMGSVGFFDFTDGFAPGWLGGRVMDMGGILGELLVVGPGDTAGFTLEVPPGTTTARMSFDLIGGDSLDFGNGWGNDIATMLINGVPVAIAIGSSGGSLLIEIPQNDGTTVEAIVRVSPGNMGGAAQWNDRSARISIEVADPTADLEFELVSDANQGINDEFWGIDNFSAEHSGHGTGF